jgi:hypothetical protein
MDGYVSKPINRELLEKEIALLLPNDRTAPIESGWTSPEQDVPAGEHVGHGQDAGRLGR